MELQAQWPYLSKESHLIETECDEYLFLTKYEYRILFGFQKSPNTKYQILFGIEKIQIPNIEYYLVFRKYE